jgi:hypothetical protein
MAHDIIELVSIILFVVFGTPTIMFTVWQLTKSRERIARMQVEARTGRDQDVARQFDDLRQEISRLRDTCTQFDVSHDNALERLEQRMRTLESRTVSTISTPGEPPRLRTIERR